MSSCVPWISCELEEEMDLQGHTSADPIGTSVGTCGPWESVGRGACVAEIGAPFLVPRGQLDSTDKQLRTTKRPTGHCSG